MPGQPPGRPAGPSIEYFPIAHYLYPPVPSLKIVHLSILIEETGIRWRRALIPYFERRSVVDFTLRKGRALGASKPTVSGVGFYLHKDFGAAEVGILSTQRMSRGRDLGFIYATNSARPGCDFIYTHV